MLTLTSHFPLNLDQLAKPPKQLYIEGDLEVLINRPRLAVVGSRKVTPYGRSVTEKLITELVRSGVVIISGLAYGVDTIAHKTCLDAGGQTIAVLPSDLVDIYPSAHAGLAKDIVTRGGALVSEYPRGSVPYPGNFIARNRLIAGLADAVLITEAAIKSGTLHTANFALEQGKTVFAVPGNITSVLSGGCNNLIKTGAVPVTSVEDILQAMGWDAEADEKEIVASTPEEHAILELLKGGISEGAILLAETGLSVQLFNQTLTMLEITGRIKPLGANQWALA
jgi:DNA processing protein